MITLLTLDGSWKEPNKISKIFICVSLIDYKKAFDCEDHEIMWIILKEMGVPAHMVLVSYLHIWY